MKLIVGLGNPGEEYKKTRHNIGFTLLDFYAKAKNISITKSKFNGLYGELDINNEKVILLKPQSYMNLSGEIVKKYIDYFKIKTDDILVINDDLDLATGRIKLKTKGSCGGHNGLRNIEDNINTQEYKRLKIGISHNRDIDTKDYVLGKFSKDEEKLIEKTKQIVNNLLDDFFYISFEQLMSKYNSYNEEKDETIR